jgi:hypothetical protein
MGDRSAFYYAPGRGSPFSSNLGPDPRNVSDHVEYIGPDHDLFTPRYNHRPSTSQYDYPEVDDNDPNAPDRIHCKYMNRSFPVDFAAYSVNEERTTVEDLRNSVAKALNTDPRQVRLIYKDIDLKHNSFPLKKYKMKQNSEVSVIITSRYHDYYRNDSGSDSGSDRDASYLNPATRRQRPRAASTIRLRSGERLPVMEPSGNSTGTYLSPNGHVPASPAVGQHRNSLRPADYAAEDRSRDDRNRGRNGETSHHREPSRHRDHSRGPPREPMRRAASPAPPPAAAQAPPPRTSPPADPNSPLGRVQALANVFYSQWIPPVLKFTNSPPSDPAVREKEYLKLSESIMVKIVEAADAIEIDGNMDAKTERKALITHANNVLKELDIVAKK